MSSAFKRKTYGKVKPVPKPKEKVPSRPSVNELKSIFRCIQTSPEWQTNDYLSKALIWWTDSLAYIQHRYKKMMPTSAAKAYMQSQEAVKKGWNATDDKTRRQAFTDALVYYQRYAAGALKTPLVLPYLKKSKEVTKKVKEANKKVVVKFDSIITLLTQCFNSCPINLVAVADIKDKSTGNLLSRRFDHQLNTMYYSRAHLVELKQRLFRKGLLNIVIEEANHLARGMSFVSEQRDGMFLASPRDWHLNYIILLKDFEWFAGTKDAPKTLVKREKIKKVKKDKS